MPEGPNCAQFCPNHAICPADVVNPGTFNTLCHDSSSSVISYSFDCLIDQNLIIAGPEKSSLDLTRCYVVRLRALYVAGSMAEKPPKLTDLCSVPTAPL